YNRALLSFGRRHRDRTLIVQVDALMRAPERLAILARARFGIDLDLDAMKAASLVDPSLITAAGAHHPIAALAAATHPACAEVLRELEQIADLPSGQPLPARLSAPAQASAPRLAIIIPCFNQGEFLIDAIASVEHTVTVPYDLLVVNDGSSEPRTLAVLACL